MPKPNAASRAGATASWALLLVALALAFLWRAPRESENASRIYLDRSALTLNALPPGTRGPVLPSWSAAALPLVVPAQLIACLLAKGAPRAVVLAEHSDGWRMLLRVEWCLLAALTVMLALRLLDRWRALHGPPDDESSSWRRVPAIALVAWALAAPGFASAVSGLSPMLLVAPLLLALAGWPLSEAPSRRRALFVGACLGLILAWAPFTWPASLLLFASGVPWRRASSEAALAFGLAIVLALAIEPRHLTHAGAAASRFVAEWIREGGWGARRDGLAAEVLNLGGFWGRFGSVALVLLLVPLWRGSRRAALLLLAIGVAQVGLPYLSGVTRAGAAQTSFAPLLLVGAGAGLKHLSSLRPRFRAVELAVTALVLSLILFGGGRRGPSAGSSWGEEMATWVGSDTLWIAERPLPGAVTAPHNAWVLPRDSRAPDRYDFAYWHRWYSGFRYVLLSGAQVRANLERSDASLPRGLYRLLQSEGRLVKEWGEGPSGYRLYRLREGGDWTRPLAERELDSLRYSPDLIPFVSSLSALYIASHRDAEAALLLRAGLRFAPLSGPLLNNLGLVYLADGDPKRAAESFDQGLRVEPQSVELLYNSARAYLALEVPNRAERNLRMALTFQPDYPPIHYELARAFLAQGKLGQGKRALGRYLALAPDATERAEAEAILRRIDALTDTTRAGALSIPASANP